MNDSKSEMKAAGFAGSVVIGTVTKVNPFAAYLRLPDMIEVGYLHISQVSEERIDAPLTNTLKEGDKIEVLVKWFDREHKRWETSHRAYQRLRNAETLSFVRGEIRLAEIQTATELGATLKFQQVRAYLTPPPHPWSKYRILFESGRLEPGLSINVVVGAWSPKVEGFIVYLPRPCLDESLSEIQYGEVIWLRPRYIKKSKRCLQSVMYVLLENNDIARVDVSMLFELEAVFPIGTRVPIRVAAVDVYTGLINASVAWELTQILTETVTPMNGEIRSGVVIRADAISLDCLLANRVVAYVHKESVLGSASEHLDKYLHLGDVIEVKFFDNDDGRIGKYKAEFIRRIEQFLEDETDESTHLDLAAVRRKGSTGGFSRDAAFRGSVLEAYDNYCCLCGKRYVVHDSTAMEAAHIVPRGSRGSNKLQNALCLCPTHHWAFDRGLITIDEDFTVKVAEIVLAAGDEGRWLAELHAKVAYFDENAPVSHHALAWHRQNIFLDG